MPLLDQTLPAFELTEADGGRVALATLVQSGPVVLAALDGGRPCAERASMLAELGHGAAELGAELVVVAPGPSAPAPEADAAGRWMTDAGHAFAALQLVHRRLGRTRRRCGVFVIDQERVLRFAFATDSPEEWIPASVVLSRLRRLVAAAPPRPAPAVEALEPEVEEPEAEVRMQELVRAVGRRLGLEGERLSRLVTACRFRDLGMATVPNAIVTKDGPLTAEEWQVVKQHPERSAQMLGDGPALDEVRAIVRASHEHLDGSGYPRGLAGDAVPLGSRILLAVESYIALTQERPYRELLGLGDALAQLEAYAGRLYDPAVVAAIAAETAGSAAA
jgi:peroxiredoxin